MWQKIVSILWLALTIICDSTHQRQGMLQALCRLVIAIARA